MNWDLRKLFKKVSHSPEPGTKPVLDGKIRASFMNDTSNSTPVSGMRTMWGVLTNYWKDNFKYKPFEGWALLNDKGFNPSISPKMVAWAITGLVLAESIFFNVASLYLIKNITDALFSKDVSGLLTQFGYMFALGAVSRFSSEVKSYLADGLKVSWQGSLTSKYTQAVLGNKAFFHIHRNPGTIDNIDQRIADDCEKIPGHVIGLSMGILNAVTLLASSGYVMLSGTPPLVAGIGLGVAFGYAAIGTWLTKKVSEPLIPLNEKQLQKNADFRRNLLSLIMKSLEIASYPTQDRVKERLSDSFARINRNYQQLRWRQSVASYVGGVYGSTREMLKWGVTAVAFYKSNMTYGGAMQYAALFEKLTEAMSIFMTVRPALIELDVRTARLTSLAQRIEEVEDLKKFYSDNGSMADIQTHYRNNSSIIFENLKINTPNGTNLIKIPRLEIGQGERVLLQGKSGCGKSTILRAMFDLWKYGTGDISLPKDANILFATQSPLVFPDVTLRENLVHPYSIYKQKERPGDPDELLFSDAECHRALELNGLSELIPFLDKTGRSEKSWEEELSAGQKQMLVFARMFLMKYDIIVLDEATSALDPEMQEVLYDRMVKNNPDATIISIAHRSEIGRFHNRFLAVTKKGTLLESIKPPPSHPSRMEMAIQKALL